MFSKGGGMVFNPFGCCSSSINYSMTKYNNKCMESGYINVKEKLELNK